MKKLLIIFGLMLASLGGFAQEEENSDNEKIRQKMTEFVQRRMRLTKAEAERFNPAFMRYFNEWMRTLRENKNDRLVLQQRIVELRLRYRDEFRQIIGDKRSEQVYDHQKAFIEMMQNLREERLRNRPPVRKRGGLLE
ncbi:MAG TPA: hypothetical protein VEB63_11025 [Chitinophagaceae bacterium]|nr:hypothetical protein [Chitinophagaceae bacterium]